MILEIISALGFYEPLECLEGWIRYGLFCWHLDTRIESNFGIYVWFLSGWSGLGRKQVYGACCSDQTAYKAVLTRQQSREHSLLS